MTTDSTSPATPELKRLRPVRCTAWLGRWLAAHPGVELNQRAGRSKGVTWFAAINDSQTGSAKFWGIGETPKEAMDKLEEVLKREAP